MRSQNSCCATTISRGGRAASSAEARSTTASASAGSATWAGVVDQIPEVRGVHAVQHAGAV
ncbi:hypothetical protein AB0N06_00110 [Streptomyces sp. NPDC051020]|uniref:hypothetical protein n=1 Tax=Streptomyces sp. NPDC051020 TaxID=3155409 RepID=UPI0034268765